MSELATPETPPPAAQRAASSSFYTAMRIMPRAQREAMFEIYAFCRAVDDIADNPGPRDARIAQLARWRQDIDSIYTGETPPHLKTLAKAIREFDLYRDDFIAVIDGMEMDVVATIRAPDVATLDLYCDRVASAVGRLSVCVFGMARKDGITLAHHLGRALQLTNILRDIDEDGEIGRLYLPKEALLSAGITSDDPRIVLLSPQLPKACAVVVAQAQEYFAQADIIMTRNPRSKVKTPRIMGSAYHMILEKLIARGFNAPRTSIKLSKVHILFVVLRHMIF
jgi:phytoene synthase